MSGQWTEWERSKFLEGLPDMSSEDSRLGREPGHNFGRLGIAGKAVCPGQRQCTQLDSTRKNVRRQKGICSVSAGATPSFGGRDTGSASTDDGSIRLTTRGLMRTEPRNARNVVFGRSGGRRVVDLGPQDRAKLRLLRPLVRRTPGSASRSSSPLVTPLRSVAPDASRLDAEPSREAGVSPCPLHQHWLWISFQRG